MNDESTKWKLRFNSKKYASVYDQLNDIFSLRRKERFEVLSLLLPVFENSQPRLLEFGTGTGVVTELLLENYPTATIVGVDGSQKMMDEAAKKILFRENNERLQLHLRDFSSPEWLLDVTPEYDLVVAVDSFHHLAHGRVAELYEEIHEILKRGGIFILSDHIVTSGPFDKERQYTLWLNEILEKLREIPAGSKIAQQLMRKFSWLHEDIEDMTVDELNKIFTKVLMEEGENPLPIMQHVDILREKGFLDVVIEYRYANFAIISARR